MVLGSRLALHHARWTEVIVGQAGIPIRGSGRSDRLGSSGGHLCVAGEAVDGPGTPQEAVLPLGGRGGGEPRSYEAHLNGREERSSGPGRTGGVRPGGLGGRGTAAPAGPLERQWQCAAPARRPKGSRRRRHSQLGKGMGTAVGTGPWLHPSAQKPAPRVLHQMGVEGEVCLQDLLYQHRLSLGPKRAIRYGVQVGAEKLVYNSRRPAKQNRPARRKTESSGTPSLYHYPLNYTPLPFRGVHSSHPQTGQSTCPLYHPKRFSVTLLAGPNRPTQPGTMSRARVWAVLMGEDQKDDTEGLERRPKNSWVVAPRQLPVATSYWVANANVLSQVIGSNLRLLLSNLCVYFWTAPSPSVVEPAGPPERLRLRRIGREPLRALPCVPMVESGAPACAGDFHSARYGSPFSALNLANLFQDPRL